MRFIHADVISTCPTEDRWLYEYLLCAGVESAHGEDVTQCVTMAEGIALTRDYHGMIVNRLIAGQSLYLRAHSSCAQEVVLYGVRAAIGEILTFFGLTDDYFEVYSSERGICLRLDDSTLMYKKGDD